MPEHPDVAVHRVATPADLRPLFGLAQWNLIEAGLLDLGFTPWTTDSRSGWGTPEVAADIATRFCVGRDAPRAVPLVAVAF
ncbi:MAG: hypothetical protein ABR532_02535, partial [Candidatus Dormibacteria bacterium]